MSSNMSINDFFSQLAKVGGIARQNRYQVFIPVASLGVVSTDVFQLISDNSETATQDWMNEFYNIDLQGTATRLTAFCDKSELPGYQFQTETMRHYGPSFKIPHMPEYQDITMTFICGAQMWERYFFDAWMYLVMDPYSNDFNYKSEYACDIIIASYFDQAAAGFAFTNVNKNGTVMSDTDSYVVNDNYWTRLVDTFPISVEAQELGYAMNDSIQRVQVTFSYKFAVPFNDKGSTTGTGVRGQQVAFQQTVGISNPSPTP